MDFYNYSSDAKYTFIKPIGKVCSILSLNSNSLAGISLTNI